MSSRGCLTYIRISHLENNNVVLFVLQEGSSDTFVSFVQFSLFAETCIQLSPPLCQRWKVTRQVQDPGDCVFGAPLDLFAYRVVVLCVAMDDAVDEALSLERKSVLLKNNSADLCVVASASSVRRYV